MLISVAQNFLTDILSAAASIIVILHDFAVADNYHKTVTFAEAL